MVLILMRKNIDEFLMKFCLQNISTSYGTRHRLIKVFSPPICQYFSCQNLHYKIRIKHNHAFMQLLITQAQISFGTRYCL